MPTTQEVTIRPVSATYSTGINPNRPGAASLGGIVGGSDALLNDDGGTSYVELWVLGNDAQGSAAAFDEVGIVMDPLVVPSGWDLTGWRAYYRIEYPVQPTDNLIPTTEFDYVYTNDGPGWLGDPSLGYDGYSTAFERDHFQDGTIVSIANTIWPRDTTNPGYQGYYPPAVGPWQDYWFPPPSYWNSPTGLDANFPARITDPRGAAISLYGFGRGGITSGGSANSVPVRITQFYIVCQLTEVALGLSAAPPCHLYPRDDSQGVGSGAIWPPPSSGRPGSYY